MININNEKSFLSIAFTSKTIAISLINSFFISFIYGYLTPLDITLNNQMDFKISFFDVAIILISSAIKCFLFVLVCSIVLLVINRKLFILFNVLILEISLSFYIQELFLNVNMIRAENGTVVGKISQFRCSINIFIHFCVIVIPVAVIAYNLAKKKLKKAYITDKLYIIMIFVILIISAMKITGFIYSYVCNNPSKYRLKEESMRYASYEPTVSFSEENNIYVFIVDRFDSFWCDEFLDVYPEVKSKLDGFTFYQNNISHYTNTFPSISSMLTGFKYNDSDWITFLNDSWKNEKVLGELKNNGYKINMILDSSTTYGKTSNIINIADNFKKPENLEYSIDKRKVREIIYNLTLSRILPDSFKNLVDHSVQDFINSEYITYSFDSENEYSLGTVSGKSDCNIYDYVANASFNSDSEIKVLTIIHLNGAHDPNETLILKTGIHDFPSEKILPTIRANFEIIFRYIDKAKELNVYDKSTFIILGDHGCPVENIMDSNKSLISPSVTALLIKPVGNESGMIKYDRSSTLSNDMFSASILDYAGINHENYGRSYRDVIESGEVVPREFKTYIWVGIGRTTPNETYLITGDARDFNNWKKTERTNHLFYFY